MKQLALKPEQLTKLMSSVNDHTHHQNLQNL